jgi:hypothetical protein
MPLPWQYSPLQPLSMSTSVQTRVNVGPGEGAALPAAEPGVPLVAAAGTPALEPLVPAAGVAGLPDIDCATVTVPSSLHAQSASVLHMSIPRASFVFDITPGSYSFVRCGLSARASSSTTERVSSA